MKKQTTAIVMLSVFLGISIIWNYTATTHIWEMERELAGKDVRLREIGSALMLAKHGRATIREVIPFVEKACGFPLEKTESICTVVTEPGNPEDKIIMRTADVIHCLPPFAGWSLEDERSAARERLTDFFYPWEIFRPRW